MFERDSILPLAAGLILSIIAHLGAAAGYASLSESPGDRLSPRIAKPSTPLPDLSASNLIVSEPRIAGLPVTISAMVRNIDTVNAGAFDIACLIDAKEVGRVRRDEGLASAEEFRAEFTAVIEQPGPHTVRLVADPDQAVAESDETNNFVEDVFVWVLSSEGQPSAELIVFDLDVPEPRVAGEPALVRVGIANFGESIDEPLILALLLDGESAGQLKLTMPMPTGFATAIETEMMVDRPGRHEVTAIIDADNRIAESDEADNALGRVFEWSGEEELKPGQSKPSDVKLNWISYEDYQELVARKSRLEQAAFQMTTQRTPEAKRTPVDPTPPAPRPAVARAQPRPSVPTQANPTNAPRQIERELIEPQPIQPPQRDEPQPTPDSPPPTTNEAPPQPQPRQAPVVEAEPQKRAVAPMQDEAKPQPPSPIDAVQPEQATRPARVVDADATTDPVDAPPAPAAAAPTVAVATPNVEPSPDLDPLLPTPVNSPAQDIAALRSPTVKPDEKSNPDETTEAVKGNPDAPREIAMLPLPRNVNDPAQVAPKSDAKAEPDAPQTARPPQPRENQENPQPTEPKPQTKPTDAPQPPPTPPAAPQQPSPKSDPTAAPREERESPPVTTRENTDIIPGQVIARQGIEIRTVLPRFSIVAIRSSVPANPFVEVTFDKTGRVVSAKMLQSSGYANIDSPILISLYRWTASGEGLKNVEDKVTFSFRYLLNK